MSRNIDVDDLDVDDVRYMQDRPWLVTEAKLQGIEDIDERMAEILEADAAENKPGYDKLNLAELRELAEKRGLDHTLRTKAKLITALEDQDAGAHNPQPLGQQTPSSPVTPVDGDGATDDGAPDGTPTE